MDYFTQMKRFCLAGLLLVLFYGVKAQSDLTPGYDIGVFYMPNWHHDFDGDRSPYTHISQTYNNWSYVDAYDRFLVSKYQFNQTRIPSAIYYQHGSGNAYGPAAWYNENLKRVTEKQLQLMSQYGIDFVIYDSFWDRRGRSFYPLWEGVIDNWLPNNGPGNPNNWDPVSTPLNNHGVEMAIMWTEDHMNKLVPNTTQGCDDFFKSGGGLDQMVNYWGQYMALPTYKKVENGRPVFYVYNETVIADMVSDCRNHAFFNNAPSEITWPQDPNASWIPFKRVKYFIEQMNAKFKARPGINKDVYFIAVVGMGADTHSWAEKWDWLKKLPDEGGFDASTALKYESWDATDEFRYWQKPGTSNFSQFTYPQMTSIAGEFHNYILNNGYSGYPNSNVDYQVPVSAGFDRAPHNLLEGKGEAQYLYRASASDYRISTPTTFGQALSQAKSYADQYAGRTDKRIVMYAWNEHSEGTVISPTKRWGYQYLQKILEVFGTSGSGPGNPGRAITTENEGTSLEEIGENNISIITSPADPSRVELNLNLTRGSDLQVQVLDLQGKVLQKELFKDQPQGTSSAQFNLNFEAQGIYIIRANALGINKTKKILLN